MVIVSDRVIRFFEFILRMDIAAIAIFPFIFARTTTKLTPRLINHEKIHLRQQRELLVIPFYIWYLIEFYKKGYMNISFEKEAYANDSTLNYRKNRKLFSFIKY